MWRPCGGDPVFTDATLLVLAAEWKGRERLRKVRIRFRYLLIAFDSLDLAENHHSQTSNLILSAFESLFSIELFFHGAFYLFEGWEFQLQCPWTRLSIILRFAMLCW